MLCQRQDDDYGSGSLDAARRQGGDAAKFQKQLEYIQIIRTVKIKQKHIKYACMKGHNTVDERIYMGISMR